MKLHYWGTAAAEGIPSVFCSCPVCREAREKKGRYIRTRSQIMIDDTLLIDFNCDTYAHSIAYDADLSKTGHVIITHVHSDHFYPDELHNRQNSFSYGMQYPALTFYGSEDVAETFALNGTRDYLLSQGRVAFELLKPYTTYDIEGYKVTPLPATHGTKNPRVYIIEKDGVTAFIVNDCGVMKDEVFDWLKESGIKFDLVSYDCTAGARDTVKDWGINAGHMGLPANIYTRNRLIENGNYKDNAISILTHFSHNGISVGYGDMKKLAEENGFILAFDGYKIEV